MPGRVALDLAAAQRWSEDGGVDADHDGLPGPASLFDAQTFRCSHRPPIVGSVGAAAPNSRSRFVAAVTRLRGPWISTPTYELSSGAV